MRRSEDPYLPIPDEYRFARPDDLAEHCRTFATELLLKNVQRSPDDRRLLASNCAALLIRLADTITASRFDGRSPEWNLHLSGAKPSFAFCNWLETLHAGSRATAIKRAVQFVLGSNTDRWLEEKRLGERWNRLTQATASNDGFHIVLREIDDVFLQRKQHVEDLKRGRLPPDFTSNEGGEDLPDIEKVIAAEKERFREANARLAAMATTHPSRKKRRKNWWKNEQKI